MLVSKNNIKIILILIFILVTYQITKISPNNYLAYSLVVVGFYLIHCQLATSENMENEQTHVQKCESQPSNTNIKCIQ